MVGLSGKVSILHLLPPWSQATSAAARPPKLCSPQWCSALGWQTSLTLTPAALGEANQTGKHRLPGPWLWYLTARLHSQLCRYKKGGYSNHTGHPADERMTEAASKRGVVLTSRSRPLEPSDLTTFDYLVGMDDSNLEVSSQPQAEALPQAALAWLTAVSSKRDQSRRLYQAEMGSRTGCRQHLLTGL